MMSLFRRTPSTPTAPESESIPSGVSRRAVVVGAAGLGIGVVAVEAVVGTAYRAHGTSRVAAKSATTPAGSTDSAVTPLVDVGATVDGGLRAVFVAAIGARFEAAAHGVRSTLTLRSVDDLIGAPSSSEAFRLAFDGALAGDGIHRISAEGVDAVDLYVGTVGPASDRGVEAIIDRRTP